MKLRSFLASFLFPLALLSGLHAEKPSPLVGNAAEVLRDDVIARVQTKIDNGAKSAADFAPEFKSLDEYAKKYAKYPELAADFALVKVGIYVDGLNDRVQARKMLVAIGRDYPDTPAAEQAAQVLVTFDQATKRAAANAELQPLTEQIVAKAQAGSRSEAEYTAELAKFEALTKKYAANREAAGNVALAKALILYMQVLGDLAKTREQLLAITAAYPDTLAAASAQKSLAALEESSRR